MTIHKKLTRNERTETEERRTIQRTNERTYERTRERKPTTDNGYNIVMLWQDLNNVALLCILSDITCQYFIYDIKANTHTLSRTHTVTLIQSQGCRQDENTHKRTRRSHTLLFILVHRMTCELHFVKHVTTLIHHHIQGIYIYGWLLLVAQWRNFVKKIFK